MNLRKIKANDVLLTYLLAFPSVIIIPLIINFFKGNKQFIYFSKITNIIGWILIGFFLIVLFLSLRKIIVLYNKRQNKKRSIMAFVFASVSISFLLNIVQYKIYLSNPNSYIVDQRIKDYYVDKHILKIDSLIKGYENEIFVIDRLLSYPPDSLIHTVMVDKKMIEIDPRFKYLGFAKLGYDFSIYFRENVLPHIDPPPPKPPTKSNNATIKTFNFYAINIVTDTLEIQILPCEKNYKYFDTLNSQIKDKANSILNILDVYNTEIKESIIKLSMNKEFIIRRGLPLGVFLIDSVHAFLGSFQDYKPLNWIGRLIEVLQYIFASLFFLPLIGEVYIFVKNGLRIK